MRRPVLLLALFVLAAALLPGLARGWNNQQPASLVLGQSTFETNIAATTQSGLTNALGVAVDPSSGKVFVADSGNNRVLRFATLSALTSGADAEGVLGQPNFGANSAATTQSGMRSPWSVAVDSAGRLWVADTQNHRVLRFDNAATKANGADADGVLGQSSFTTFFESVTASAMSWPVSVTIGASGHLWVTERSNHRVLRFDNAASKANGAAADGVLGQPDFTTRSATTTQTGMSNPYSALIDSAGHLWVADSGNNRVLRFDTAASKANGANADGVLGQTTFTNGTLATTQSRLAGPVGLATDSTGRLWVADRNNNRVLRFDNAANKANGANADGVLGQDGFTTKTAALSQSAMNSPFGLATDTVGNLWVADINNNRLMLFKDATGVAITRGDSDPTSAASVTFVVTFSSPVTGVSAANFALTASGEVSGATITDVTGSGATWTVTAATGSGSGSLRLDMTSTAGVQDGNGSGVTNLPYVAGEGYTISKPVPTTVAITRGDSDPTSAASVTFIVTFSAPVTGVSAANFTLTAGGEVSGAAITNVVGSGTTWTVTAATGSGSGSLRLDMTSTEGVQDGNNGSIANLPYTIGESYTISKALPTSDVATSLGYQRAASGMVTFTLVVENSGPNAADGTLVVMNMPQLPSGAAWTWSCSGSGGAACPPNGTGDLAATLSSLPAGGRVVFTLASSAPPAGAWVATATATVPSSTSDTSATNNSATARSYLLALPVVVR